MATDFLSGLGKKPASLEVPASLADHLTPRFNTPRILKVDRRKSVTRSSKLAVAGNGNGEGDRPSVFVTDIEREEEDELSLLEALMRLEEEQQEELEDLKEAKDRSRSLYEAACKRCGVLPSKAILHHVVQDHVKLQNHSLGINGIKPLCIALVSNVYVTSLDLEDNDLGPAGAAAVADVLSENVFITDLNLAENKIGSDGARSLTKVLSSNRTLRNLNLSGNDFGENDAKYFANLLSANYTLKALRLSHNAFREKGGQDLCDAISENTTLEALDLSWNHLRLKGAVAICRALAANTGLVELNLAWNGFGLIGCHEMAIALQKNNTLRDLDLSANRIDNLGLEILLKGLTKNTKLEVLKLGSNPIYGEAVSSLLDWIETHMSSGIKLIDLTLICIDEDFLEKLKCIQRIRDLVVIHGSVVNPPRQIVSKPRGSIFDTPTDPTMVLFEYMKQSNLRLVDFFHVLDRDKSDTISKQEFKEGLQSVNIPLSERALNSLMNRLDLNNDGQIDFGEFVVGHKQNTRKVGKATNSDERKLQQFTYLREKVKRFVTARKKAKEATTNPRTGFVTAVFKHVHDHE